MEIDQVRVFECTAPYLTHIYHLYMLSIYRERDLGSVPVARGARSARTARRRVRQHFGGTGTLLALSNSTSFVLSAAGLSQAGAHAACALKGTWRGTRRKYAGARTMHNAASIAASFTR
jgi:hypothetical protein